MKTVILIANSEWALLVQLEEGNFEIIQELEHPQSKEKIEHLVSDRPGRTFSRVSDVRHALNEGQDVADAEREKFAREVVKLLHERYKNFPFNQLWVVSGPKFLGELRPLFHRTFVSPLFSIREVPKEISPRESFEGKIGKVLEWVHGSAPRKRASLKYKFLKES